MSNTNKSTELITQTFSSDLMEFRRKFVVRHSGNGKCVCDGCKCPGCPCPLGVCTCFWETFEPATPHLTVEEIGEDIGSLYIFKHDSLKVKLIFEQVTALDDGTVPIGEGDLYLSYEESIQLGFEDKIALRGGVYTANFETNIYGEILVDVYYY